MGSIKDKVAIIGMGCTKFGELWNKSFEDLAVEAAREAYEDAGIDAKDIQAAWFASEYAATGARLAYALKLDYIPVTRVENACCSGTEAIRNAAYGVAAGAFDLVLAIGVEKLKDTGYTGLPAERSYSDPGNVTSPIMFPTHFALMANRYFEQYGITCEEGKRTLAKIAVKNHHNGTMSPKAHFQREITLEQVLNAPIISYPLGLFDCCGNSDGAAAAILVRADLAKNFRDDYVLIKGTGLSCGARQAELQNDYDFVHIEETCRAAKMAYEEAGIKNAREEIDLAIVHDCFSITELITYEDLGFSDRGKAREDVDKGTFTLTGDLPVNTDGGLKCFGHPVGASGLRMAYEVYKQIQGKAGPRQLKEADMGLTHNVGGTPGLFNATVTIFGRRVDR